MQSQTFISAASAKGALSTGSTGLLRLIQSGLLDVPSLASYLHRSTHPGVCDVILNQLFLAPIDEIEEYMPQLCNVFLHRLSDTSSFEMFALEKASQSLHMALRFILILDACIQDNHSATVKKALALRQSIETAAVNRKNPMVVHSLDNLGQWDSQPPPQSLPVPLRPLSASESPLPPSGGPVVAVEEHVQILPNSSSFDAAYVSSPRPDRTEGDGGDAAEVPPMARERAHQRAVSFGGDVIERTTKGVLPTEVVEEAEEVVQVVVSSAERTSITSLSTDKPRSYSAQSFLNNAAPSAPAPSRASVIGRSMSMPNLEVLFYAKQHTCDFLNDELRFINSLTKISSDLRLLPPGPIRVDALRGMLRALNEALPRNAYVPLCSSTDRFHRVVNLVADEAAVMNSRERAPYLLLLEVLETRTTCSDGTVFPHGTFGCNSPHQPQPPTIELGSVPTARTSLPSTPASGGGSSSNSDSCSFGAECTLCFEQMTHLTLNEPVSYAHQISESHFQQYKFGPSVDGSPPPTASPRTTEPAALFPQYPLAPLSRSQSPPPPRSSDSPTPTAGTSLPLPLPKTSPVPHRHSLRGGSQGIDEDLLKDFVLVERPPGINVFGELFREKAERIKRGSEFGQMVNWRLVSVIVKYGDDLRQEELAMQLIAQFKRIFDESKVDIYLRPYRILATSSFGGLIETIPNAMSIDSLKKRTPNFTTLLEYFRKAYGPASSPNYQRARLNFIQSMAGYSIVCYFLQVKDRHNGNIMISNDGHIIHIDFGFMFCKSPGAIKFEQAPFKLSQEFVEVMGGPTSPTFSHFRDLMVQGFIVARKNMDKIVNIVESMLPGAYLPCFSTNGQLALDELRDRFKITYTDSELKAYVNDLIDQSLNSWTGPLYDSFQYLTNGIL